MERLLKNKNFSVLFICRRIFLWDIRTKGFLSFLFFYFQSVCIFISHSYKSWTSARTVKSNFKTQKQRSNTIQKGVRLSKEEVIMVMEGLGLSVESDGEGLGEEIGEEEVEALFEKEPSFEELKDAFEVIDENGDGFIEAKELQKVLKCLGLERDIGECKRMVSAVDQNGDGLMDRHEFVKFMEQSFEV